MMADTRQFWYLCEIMYIVANGALKFSIGYFYLRVAIQRWHVWTIKLLMGGTILFSFVYLFLVIFQCIPGMSLIRTSAGLVFPISG